MCRLNAALWYNMWPDVEVPERWENRFTWIGRYLCCHYRPYSGDKEVRILSIFACLLMQR